ncbi:hypothetical protein ACIPMU_36695 [Streptomyces cyaneofuscatus]|uniref:hypothetical protein n=1 Tax=Streptomyces cyaneofuscatus TaxID=66883 RepID=UPI0038226319
MSTTIPCGPAPASEPEGPAPRTSTAPECHVVTHVHWNREWYRPFEALRARLMGAALTSNGRA